MRYEKLLSAGEKDKWLDLEVTIGTNESLIEAELLKLQNFIQSFDEDERDGLEGYIGERLQFPFSLNNSPKVLKLLLIKQFINQHGLSIIREVRVSPTSSENRIFLDITRALFVDGKYPEDIYVYSTYRRRGTPNTWFKVISEETPEEIENKLTDSTEKLRRFVNYRLDVSRKLRFSIRVGGLLLILFSKPIPAKVIKGEDRNIEAQKATYTIVVLDKENKKIGIVSGSKKEVQLMQYFIRYKLFKDSIATPRSDHELDKKELLKNILVSSPERSVRLKAVSFKSTLMPAQPSMHLKVTGTDSLDDALEAINRYWEELGIDSLKSATYEWEGKTGTAYAYGDDWNRMYINVSAKKRSVAFENRILEDLNERIGVDVKESRFIIEPLTDEYILEKIFAEKKVPTFPPIPEKAEKLLVKLVSRKIIKPPTNITKRKCQICYTDSWEDWACPGCDRQEMTLVGESVNIELNEIRVSRDIFRLLESGLRNYQVTYIPYKQRRKYKKSVVRLHNPTKNLSVFLLFISDKKDLNFVKDLLNEGFGVTAIVDPNMTGKIDYIQNLGCSIVPLHKALDSLLNSDIEELLLPEIEIQEQKVLERIFENLRTAIGRLRDKPVTYNEDLFEIDVTNVFQAIVPDVVRLGTEYKAQKVPDGYCCYGYRNNPLRKRKRLLGWDAKYSYSASYRLVTDDLKKQKGYISWLTKRGNEAHKMGSLGIYAFVSNFEDSGGFESVMSRLSSAPVVPKQCRIILVEDAFLVKIGEWLLENWRQVLANNSMSSEAIFQFIRRKRGNSIYNIIRLSDWDRLKAQLDNSL